MHDKQKDTNKVGEHEKNCPKRVLKENYGILETAMDCNCKHKCEGWGCGEKRTTKTVQINNWEEYFRKKTNNGECCEECVAGDGGMYSGSQSCSDCKCHKPQDGECCDKCKKNGSKECSYKFFNEPANICCCHRPKESWQQEFDSIYLTSVREDIKDFIRGLLEKQKTNNCINCEAVKNISKHATDNT